MLEVHFDNRGEVAIENLAELTRSFPQHASRAMASGMKSEGFRLKGLIKAAIQRGGLNGEWARLNPHTGILSKRKNGWIKNFKWVCKGERGNQKRVRQYKDYMGSTRSNPLARLAGAVRYIYDSEQQLVRIGFVSSAGISKNLLKLATLHAAGSETSITPKMRKMLFGVGFPIKKTTTMFKTPPRPVIGPVFEQEKNMIAQNLESKFWAAIERYWSGGSRV